ncbi:Hypothetical_protein [Hexamita inflata]|uniref:Hypothetical_protein n=1 Tax=Hexamita inflata TaxID=28002 RepID=A0AA86TV05_9EUKA|nr:Hypothetical protein HINF_LOCUS15812 [Hexamita inflata]
MQNFEENLINLDNKDIFQSNLSDLLIALQREASAKKPCDKIRVQLNCDAIKKLNPVDAARIIQNNHPVPISELTSISQFVMQLEKYIESKDFELIKQLLLQNSEFTDFSRLFTMSIKQIRKTFNILQDKDEFSNCKIICRFIKLQVLNILLETQYLDIVQSLLKTPFKQDQNVKILFCSLKNQFGSFIFHSVSFFQVLLKIRKNQNCESKGNKQTKYKLKFCHQTNFRFSQ